LCPLPLVLSLGTTEKSRRIGKYSATAIPPVWWLQHSGKRCRFRAFKTNRSLKPSAPTFWVGTVTAKLPGKEQMLPLLTVFLR